MTRSLVRHNHGVMVSVAGGDRAHRPTRHPAAANAPAVAAVAAIDAGEPVGEDAALQVVAQCGLDMRGNGSTVFIACRSASMRPGMGCFLGDPDDVDANLPWSRIVPRAGRACFQT